MKKLVSTVNRALTPLNIALTRRTTLDNTRSQLLAAHAELAATRAAIEGTNAEIRRLQRAADSVPPANVEPLPDVVGLEHELLRHQIANRWSVVDAMERATRVTPEYRTCPLCEATERAESFAPYITHCIFGGGHLHRYQCPACDVIFGADKMFDLSASELTQEYEWHYKVYEEGDSTDAEVRAFHSLNPRRDGVYVNYGAGSWSRTVPKLREEGWNVLAYEPHGSAAAAGDWLIASEAQMHGRQFDGIFSNNVLEHFREPAEDLRRMTQWLKPGALMAHATPCFEYLFEYTRFHLFFFLGRSREVLAKRAGLRIEGFEVDGNFMNCLYSNEADATRKGSFPQVVANGQPGAGPPPMAHDPSNMRATLDVCLRSVQHLSRRVDQLTLSVRHLRLQNSSDITRPFLVEAHADGLPPFPFEIHRSGDGVISEILEQSGTWEPLETKVLLRLCRPGDYVLDIGGNIGWYSTVLARALGPTGRIVTFEPDSANFQMLTRNMSRVIGGASPTLYQGAVSDSVGTLRLFLSESNFGDHRIFDDGTPRQSMEVPTHTLDALLANEQRLPDLVKSDTQGSEARILRGARATLARGWRPVLVIEFWPFGLVGSGDDPFELWGLLEELGYQMYELTEDQPRLVPLNSESIRAGIAGKMSAASQQFINIVAMPDGCDRLSAITDLIDFQMAA